MRLAPNTPHRFLLWTVLKRTATESESSHAGLVIAFLKRSTTVLTSLPRSENRINWTRRRGILESHLPAKLFVRPFRYEDRNPRFLQWSFIANASRWCQAVLRTVNRIKPVLLRQKNML